MKRRNFFAIVLAAVLSAATLAASHARAPSLIEELGQVIQSYVDTVPASAQIDVGFSPEGGAERLVLKAINGASVSVRLAAYAFTSTSVVRALISAKRRGVDVKVVVDDSAPEHRSGEAALNLLLGADIPTRTSGRYAIHHDKYLIVDGLHVQTGSFNYSRAAAVSNSENVIVIWHNPQLAESYLRHWNRRYSEGKNFVRRY